MNGFRVDAVDYATHADQLHAVREAVFIREQNVPAELERDALDPLCRHALARDDAGHPIGAARLTPKHTLGRMAVLKEWRGRGVGDALLQTLLAEARAMRWPELRLHAQVSAEHFYVRHGFVPEGGRFLEAGIEHQSMRRNLLGPTAIDTRTAAVAIVSALALNARRSLQVYSRDLDPGLFDQPAVLEAMRRLATRRPGAASIRILLHDAAAPQRELAPLLPLAQRLSSTFAFRRAADPVDLAYPSAFMVNDAGGWYFRPLGHSFEGEADLNGAARARQLAEAFERVWERARPCTELRALGI